MSQDRWKELVVGKIYGELSPEDEREFEQACRDDPSCATEFEALSSVRRRLAEVRHRPLTQPVEPGRVVVLPAPRRRVTPWGFGAGFAAAAALLIVGFLVGQTRSGGTDARPAGADVTTAAHDLSGLDEFEIQERQSEFDRRLSALESGIPRAASRKGSLPVMPGQEAFSRDDLLQLANRVSYERENDLAYVLQELAQMENRMMSRVQTNETLVRVLLTRHQEASGTPTR